MNNWAEIKVVVCYKEADPKGKITMNKETMEDVTDCNYLGSMTQGKMKASKKENIGCHWQN